MATASFDGVVVQVSLSAWSPIASERRFAVLVSKEAVESRPTGPHVGLYNLTPAQANALPMGTPITLTLTF